MIREELGCNTSVGASNVTFGLPRRPALNGAFMAMAIAAGMPCAITNPLEAEIRQSIMAANLIVGTDENCLAWIAASREDAQSQNQSTEQAARVGAADAARTEREARRAARRVTTNSQDDAASV